MDQPSLSAGGKLARLPSVKSGDLLGKYADLYMSSSVMPLCLAQQIEGTTTTSSVSLGNADSRPGDLIARMEARMTALELRHSSDMAGLRRETSVLRAENVALRTENVDLRADIVALRADIVALQNDVVGLRAQSTVSGNELEGAKTKLRLLSAMEAVLVRKLIEKCRKMCNPQGDWNLVIDDAQCLSCLTSLGLRRGYGLNATHYGPRARMKHKGDTAAQVISEDKSLYAEVICSRIGSEKKSLVEIYKFVFDGSDPEQDCFDRAKASTPRT